MGDMRQIEAHTQAMRTHAAVALLLVLTLAACGGDSGDAVGASDEAAPPSTTASDGASEPAPFDVAPCSEQWVEGGVVREVYGEGCMEGDMLQIAFLEDCADGSTFIHSPKGFGITGQEVHLPAPGEDEPDVNSEDYKRVQAACHP